MQVNGSKTLDRYILAALENPKWKSVVNQEDNSLGRGFPK